MQSQLISAVALASIASISIAGSGCSKSNTRLLIADEQTLETRVAVLEKENADFIHYLGILPALAGKKILKSEINQAVDKAADDCWKTHIETVKKWIAPESVQQCDLAHSEFNARFEQIKPMLIEILITDENPEK